MRPRRLPAEPKLRTRALRIVTAAVLVASAVFFPVSASAAAPIVIDDFGGTQISTPDIMLSNGGGTSKVPTSAPGDGVHRFELFGDGNSSTSAELDYSFDEIDLTSAGSNTQFMVGLDSVERGPDLPPGQTAVNTQITVTDATGATGQYSTGFANVTDFDLVLNFACTDGASTCFSGSVDFTRVTGVTLSFYYPQNYDSQYSTVVVVDELRTTPTGGTQPPAPVPVIALETPPTSGIVWAQGATELRHSVEFRSNGARAEMASVDLAQASVVTTGSLDASITAVADAGGGVYEITTRVASGSGTVAVSLPEGTGTDIWGQQSTAVTSTAVSVSQGEAPNIDDQTFTARAGQEFSGSLTASGIPAPVFSAQAVLPTGLELTADGILTTADDLPSGTYDFSVRATNPLGVDQATVRIAVEDVRFTSAAAAEFSTTAPSSFLVTWDAPDGTTISGYDELPSGLTAAPEAHALHISGIADRSAAGVTVLPLTLTPPSGPPVVQELSLTVNAPPAFIGERNFKPTVGAPFDVTVMTNGWPAAEVSLLDALPDGLEFTDNGDGTAGISGTPVGATGRSTVTARADNGAGTASADLSFDVRSVPTIAPITDQQVEAGTSVSVPLITGGVPAPTVTADALPDWIALTGDADAGWALRVSPTSPDDAATVTLTATNAVSSESRSVSFSSYELPTVSGPENLVLVAGREVPAGTAYAVEGSPAPEVEVTGLPSGVSAEVDDGTVTLTGTPDAAGASAVTIAATNPHGREELTIAVTVDSTPEVAPIDAAEVPVGTAFTREVQASGQPAPALTAADLPAGVTFTDHGDGTGTLSGAPSDRGESVTTIHAENRAGEASATFALTATARPEFVSGDAIAFESGVTDEFTITTEAYPVSAITLAGDVPAGLAFADNGDGTATLSGTASDPGRASLQLTADNGSDVAEQTLVVTVWDAPAFTSAPSAAFTVGEEGEAAITTTGFPVPSLALTGALPAGLSFIDNGDGTALLSGVPADGTAGAFPVTITATTALDAPAAVPSSGFAPLAAQPIASTQELRIDVAPADVIDEEPPGDTDVPDDTDTPDNTDTPDDTSTDNDTNTPDDTDTPDDTSTDNDTGTGTGTDNDTNTPDDTSTDNDTNTRDDTDAPGDTGSDDGTGDADGTEVPNTASSTGASETDAPAAESLAATGGAGEGALLALGFLLIAVGVVARRAHARIE